MIQKLQHMFALSRQGALDLIKASFACVLQNISLMLPAGLLFSMIQDLMKEGIQGQRIYFYIIGCIIFLILIMLSTYLQYNTAFFATYKESGVRRISLAENLRKIPLSFFGKKDVSDLTSTIMADSTMLEMSFSHFVPQLFGAIISTLIIAISLFAVNVQLALSALWVIPVSFLIIILSSKYQERLNSKQMNIKMECADGIQEGIEAVQDLKANNAEKKYLEGLNKKIDNVEKSAIKTEISTAIFVVSSTLILKFGIVSVALVGSKLLVSGSIDILTFILFLFVVSRLYGPLEGALMNLTAILSTRTNTKRMNEILEYPLQVGETKLSNIGSDIVFDNVSFSYNNKDSILQGVSFTAKQGEITALVGPSGGGKTTVSRLAARFWDVNQGSIKVGGMDISKIDPETLLSLYAIVFQDVTLFDNTIMENIRIGKKDATDQEVLEAARLANCDQFASLLEEGYHSRIGENGSMLSGGERQRISIARAILKNAPIVILDEATASLDVENETMIQTALSRLMQDKTVLIIAHRMRTVSNSDKIVALSGGKVAEIGSPSTLQKAGGIYANMVDLQNKSSNWSL